MNRRLVGLVVFVLLMVLGAGCGGSKSSNTSSTTDWANGLCSAITTWTGSLKAAGDSLKGGNLSKDSLQSAANDVTSATDTFVNSVKDLGKPDTQAGQQAKASVDKLADELKSDKSQVEDALKGVSGLSGVISAVPAVSAALATMSTQVKSTFSELEQLDAKGELQTAFKDAESCSSLTSSS